MRRKHNPNGGRPTRDFDAKTFEGLCFIQSTVKEIEAVMIGDIETISNWCRRTYGMCFSDSYKRFSEGGKASMRRNQIRLSEKNAAMSIWIGKQYLGQKEPESVQNTSPNDAALNATFQLLKQNEDLKKELDELKSKTNTELPASEQTP